MDVWRTFDYIGRDRWYSLMRLPPWDFRDIIHGLSYSFMGGEGFAGFEASSDHSVAPEPTRVHLNLHKRMAAGSVKTMSKLNRGPQIDVDEVRLIADLRIMHAKVHELFEIVTVLKRGHEDSAIRRYADHVMLEKDIQRVDDLYLWFLSLKEEGLKLRKK
jgi:hypothetical protein